MIKLVYLQSSSFSRLTAHGIDYDHGWVYWAAEGYHGTHGYTGVVSPEGLEDTEVAGTVCELT